MVAKVQPFFHPSCLFLSLQYSIFVPAQLVPLQSKLRCRCDPAEKKLFWIGFQLEKLDP